MTGICFRELKLKNCALYKEASLNLQAPGVTLILGANKDANPGSTNAVGKTYLVAQLPELLYDQSPVAGRRTKDAGLVSLAWKSAKHEYELKRRTSKSDEFRLYRDGVDTNVRRTYLKDALAKAFPLTEEEFFNLVYLDSSRPHVLQSGSSALRRNFITSFFRLSNVDELRKQFSREMGRSAEARAVYASLREQREQLDKQAPDVDEAGLELRVQKLQARYDRRSEEVHSLTAKAELWSYRVANETTLKKLLALVPNLDDFERVHDEQDAKISKARSVLRAVKDRDAQLAAYRAYVAEAKPIRRKLDAIGVSMESARKAAETKDEYVRQLELYRRERQHLIDELPPKVEQPDLALLDVDLDALAAKLANKRALAESNKQFKTGKCPCCGQRVKVPDLSQLEDEIDKLAEKVSAVRKAQRDAELRRSRQAAVRKIKNLVRPVDTADRVALEAHELYQQLPRRVARPEVDSSLPSYEDAERRLQTAQRKTDFLATLRPSLPVIKKCLAIKEPIDLDAVATARDDLSELAQRLADAKAALSDTQRRAQERRQLTEKMKALREEALNEDAYKLLVEAYGNSGIKRIMIQRIATHLQECLNKYSRYVFSERYEFAIKCETQFDILVTRKYASHTKTIDVRKLSGAERRAFSLLLFLSLLSLTPASRRSNLLILDEPDINMGPEMKENFGRFIKVLNKIVPHIVIVTPNLDNQYEGARVITVVKKNGVSKLVAGVVS